MKTFGKIIITALLVALNQNAMAQFEVGLPGGYSGHWILNTALNGNESIHPHNGYYVGILGSYTFNKPYTNNDGKTEEDPGHNNGFQIGVCFKLEVD